MPLIGLQTRLPLRSASKRLSGVFGAAAAVVLLTGIALPARAQDAGKNAPAPTAEKNEKHVSIDAEEATLASVLTTLMRSVGANYTLDSSLRTIRITAHLHDLRLDTLLDVLLRGTTPTVTYRYEDSVYRFLIKPETPRGGQPIDEPVLQFGAPGVRRMQVVRVRFLDAAEAARLLGGIPLRVEGQTFGLIDPTKPIGLASSPGTPNGSAGGAQPGAAGGTSAPANLLDYIWILNAGAGF